MHSVKSVLFASKLGRLKQTHLIRNVSAASRPKVRESPRQPFLNVHPPQSDSFIQNLFKGESHVSNFFPYPQLLSREDLAFVNMIGEPMERLFTGGAYDALKVEQDGLSPAHLKMMKELGVFGLTVPSEYGGVGCNNTQFARLAEMICGYDLGVAVLIAAHQSIGFKGLLLYGSEEQKRRYLPGLATGEKIACFALTEPSGGSDAAGIKSRAVLNEAGTHWILNGSKSFISNGGIADYFTLFAQTPVKSSTGEMEDKITAFFVSKLDGLSCGPPWEKMGIASSNTTDLYFDNVAIPAENVLGPVGDGFKVAMNILNNGRYGMVCALSGTMKHAISIATRHANQRTQFGAPLASYTGIQEKLARMTMVQYATQSMAYMLAGLMDQGVKEYQLEAAVSKVYASEGAKYVVDECLQILGGMGYMRETGVEKLVRDVRVFPVFEGTNDIMRLFVALTGIQHASKHLKELQRAMKNPVANFGILFEEGARRLKRSINEPSSADLTQCIDPYFETEARQLAHHIRHFGSAIEGLMLKYGKGIMHEQLTLNRVSAAVSDIYVMLVVLSRASKTLEKGSASAEQEKQLARVICSEASARIGQLLGALRSPAVATNDTRVSNIARDVLKHGGLVHEHPLN